MSHYPIHINETKNTPALIKERQALAAKRRRLISIQAIHEKKQKEA